MAKGISLLDWQLDNANTLGTSGKGISGRDKFNGSAQDFSDKINLNPKRSGEKRKKFGAKKQRNPTVFQYLKKAGYGKTYVEVQTKCRLVGSTIVNTMVIVVDRFLFDNEVKKFGSNIVSWYYENKKEETFSELFR